VSTIILLSSMAPRAILGAAAGDYQASRGVRIDARAAGGVDVVRRIEAGEAVDLVVLSSESIDKLVQSGYLAGGTRRDLMRSGIAAAVRAGASSPAMSDEASVRRAVLEAPSISYSTGPSGRYLESLFDRWSILQEIRPRIIVPPPGTPVAELVASGTVALGFQQWSELLEVPGIDVAGPLPSSIQHLTTFSGAVSVGSIERETAAAFLADLASAEREPLKRRFGMTGI
jgi:molybdate transport system substrate-binding protein